MYSFLDTSSTREQRGLALRTEVVDDLPRLMREFLAGR